MGKINIQTIETVVCQYYNIDYSDLKSKERKKENAKARGIFFYFSEKFCNLSLQKIGNHVNRNHSTVIYWLNLISNEKNIYKDLANELREIEIILLKNNSIVETVDLLEIAKLNTLQMQYLS